MIDYMPLTFLAAGEKGQVVDIKGGRGIVQRLYEIGFVPSTVVEILVSHNPGPILVNVKGARIAIGRGMAAKIMVRRL